MSIDKYQPHLLVLPEDDANRQVAIGFLLDPSLNSRVIQVLPEARGWKDVVERFIHQYAFTLQQYPDRMIALLIDFDEDENRLNYVKEQIPENVESRVFVLGVLSEPEKLRSDIKKSFEEIGEALAKDCSSETNKV
ncbi:hypothetical protein ACKFKF_10400 [Phormidesmis sp. 146-12]